MPFELPPSYEIGKSMGIFFVFGTGYDSQNVEGGGNENDRGSMAYLTLGTEWLIRGRRGSDCRRDSLIDDNCRSIGLRREKGWIHWLLLQKGDSNSCTSLFHRFLCFWNLSISSVNSNNFLCMTNSSFVIECTAGNVHVEWVLNCPSLPL